jgi:GntR family transcriptional regulator, carbon starvation induced regulator
VTTSRLALVDGEGTDSQKRTLASTIYARLRREILTGTIRPNAKLNTRELCDRFSVGLSPMREALNRLSAEGLAQQTDNRGFSVTPVSVAELLDLNQARCWINEVGLRQSIARADQAWEENLLVAFHRLSRTPRHIAESASNPEWENAHRVFHRSLISGCGSHWLVDTCERYFDASERYRHLTRLSGVSRSDQQEEHRAIMQAAIDRQADEAVRHLTNHFNRTAELVMKAVSEVPSIETL